MISETNNNCHGIVFCLEGDRALFFLHVSKGGWGHAFHRIIISSLILFCGLSGDIFCNKRLHCVISAQKALFTASGMLHPVHFRLWLI